MDTTRSVAIANILASIFACAVAVGTTGCFASAPPREAATLGTACVRIQRGLHGEVSDTRVSEALPGHNFGSYPLGLTGEKAGGERGMLLAFDLRDIPKDARVTRATVTLHRRTNGVSQMTVHRVNASWTESEATWSNVNGLDGKDEATVVTDEAVASGPVSFDITQLAQAWATGASPNHGIELDESAGKHVFATSEAYDVQERPSLDVCYVPSAAPRPLMARR
jgi:hypothetical protein